MTKKPLHFRFFQTCFVAMMFVSLSSLAQQICDTDKPRSTPIDNFQLTSSGFVIQTYYDKFTKKREKRYWMACSLGQLWTGLDCTGEKSEFDFEETRERVASIRYAGFDDWRLPTLEEFRSIVEWQCHSPAVDKLVFPGIDQYSYWTSEKQKNRPELVWVMNFASGEAMFANVKQRRYSVAVREERKILRVVPGSGLGGTDR